MEIQDILVSSFAGKPIYYFGQKSNTELVTLTGLITACLANSKANAINFLSSNHDQTCIVFYQKNPLIYTCFYKISTSIPISLRLQTNSDYKILIKNKLLKLLHNQIVSILTFNQINRIFERNPGFDLLNSRHWNEHDTKLLDNLVEFFKQDISGYFAGIGVQKFHNSSLFINILTNLKQAIKTTGDFKNKTTPLSSNIFSSLTSADQGNSSTSASDAKNNLINGDNNIIFALIFNSSNQLCIQLNKKGYHLDSNDLKILLNYCNFSGFSNLGEHWQRFCLPNSLDENCFIGCYMYCLDEIEIFENSLNFEKVSQSDQAYSRKNSGASISSSEDEFTSNAYKLILITNLIDIDGFKLCSQIKENFCKNLMKIFKNQKSISSPLKILSPSKSDKGKHLTLEQFLRKNSGVESCLILKTLQEEKFTNLDLNNSASEDDPLSSETSSMSKSSKKSGKNSSQPTLLLNQNLNHSKQIFYTCNTPGLFPHQEDCILFQDLYNSIHTSATNSSLNNRIYTDFKTAQIDNYKISYWQKNSKYNPKIFYEIMLIFGKFSNLERDIVADLTSVYNFLQAKEKSLEEAYQKMKKNSTTSSDGTSYIFPKEEFL